MQKVQSKVLSVFFLIHFFLWTIIPCFRKILPLDTLEAIVWGAMKQWGTNKHPPLSGWLAYGFFKLNLGDVSLYALSALCVLVGLFFIFKTAEIFLSQSKAICATLLMEGIMYYNFSSVEFNVNVVSLALWPATTYFFIKAVLSDRKIDWLYLGFFAGLNMLNKYVCGVLFLSFFCYLIFTKQGRSRFKSLGPYLALFVGLITILPHLIWLYQTDFFIIDYFLGRSSSVAYHVSNHILCPLRFLGVQIVFTLPVLLAYFLLYRSAQKESSSDNKTQKQLLFYTGLLPLLLTTAISAISGVRLKSMWGFPLLYMTTVLLFFFFPFKLEAKQNKKIITVSFVFLFLFAGLYLVQIMCNAGKNFSTPPKEFIAKMDQIWHEEEQIPLTTVGGGTWQTSALFVYHPTVKNVLFQMEFYKNPWFDKNLIDTQGILIVDENKEQVAEYQKKYPNAIFKEYQLETKNWFKKKRSKTIYYTIIKENAP